MNRVLDTKVEQKNDDIIHLMSVASTACHTKQICRE